MCVHELALCAQAFFFFFFFLFWLREGEGTMRLINLRGKNKKHFFGCIFMIDNKNNALFRTSSVCVLYSDQKFVCRCTREEKQSLCLYISTSTYTQTGHESDYSELECLALDAAICTTGVEFAPRQNVQVCHAPFPMPEQARLCVLSWQSCQFCQCGGVNYLYVQ